MRKLHVIIFFGILLLIAQPNVSKANQVTTDKTLLEDAFTTSLYPLIQDELVKYYGYAKQLYNEKIIKIKREHEGGRSFFVTIQVTSFEQAHNYPFGKETLTFYITPRGPEAISFCHEGDEWEKKIEKFYKRTISDIKKSFDLNLKGFKEYNYNQITYRAEKQGEFRSLSNIIEGIKAEILTTGMHPPYKNVIDPVAFLKGGNGYILFKKTDGTNVTYKIKKKNKLWTVVDKKIAPGKKMKYELLYYM